MNSLSLKSILVVVATAFGLSACTHLGGTVVGAAVGGGIGHEVTGSTAGAIGGAAIGGFIGHEITH